MDKDRTGRRDGRHGKEFQKICPLSDWANNGFHAFETSFLSGVSQVLTEKLAVNGFPITLVRFGNSLFFNLLFSFQGMLK